MRQEFLRNGPLASSARSSGLAALASAVATRSWRLSLPVGTGFRREVFLQPRQAAGTMSACLKASLLLVCIALPGCLFVSYPPDPTVAGFRKNPEPRGEEEILRGVVAGLWKLDPEQAFARMTKYEGHLTPEEISEYSQRYVVRIVFHKASPVQWLSPVRLSKAAERVVLPAGWSHDPFLVSTNPEIVNVGDVVDVRFQEGRYYHFLGAIVRQCDARPVDGERKEWQVGCKTYRGFDKSGYAGETH